MNEMFFFIILIETAISILHSKFSKFVQHTAHDVWQCTQCSNHNNLENNHQMELIYHPIYQEQQI
jgi:hypothetical protein